MDGRKYLILCGIGGISLIAGCSGGGGGSSGPTSQTSTGYYIDAPVEGLEYSTSSGISGTTGKNGEFQYRSGDNVTFKIGNVTLGTAKGSFIVTPLDLVNTNDTSNQKVRNIAGLVLYLDNDGDPSNGIVIDKNKMPNVTSPVDLSQTTTLPSDLQNAIDNAPVDPTTHLNQTIDDIMRNHIAGTYSGTYTTTNNPGNYCASGGTAEVTVDAAGNVTGTATANTGATFTVTGSMQFRSLNASGTASGGSGTATWTGTWRNNAITGNWSYSDPGGSCSGTFTVTKQ